MRQNYGEGKKLYNIFIFSPYVDNYLWNDEDQSFVVVAIRKFYLMMNL